MSNATVMASHIKELRELTGVGVLACKKALAECDNDIPAAVDYLRKISGIKAERKAGRETLQGAIACVVDATTCRSALLEVNCETDFVALSDEFTAFIDRLANRVLQREDNGGNGADLMQNEEIEQERTQLVQKFDENIRIRRWKILSGGSGCHLGSYLHSNRRLGTLVGLAGGNADLAKQLAMHVAAMNPTVVAAEDVPEAMLQREAEIYRAQIAGEGKPAELHDRIITGRLKKFAAEMSLVEQEFVREPGKSVGDLLRDAGATVTGFVRFELGEKAPDSTPES